MKRQIYDKLTQWRINPRRKPLMLFGVRQVGKTFALKTFAKQFAAAHYINFEKAPIAVHAIFDRDLNPKRIITEISLYLKQDIDIKNDVLIFDEIQACPRAITSLKYFNEELSELALCTAGSLLGVHLNGTSFPVGMVDMLHLYPLSFFEFLENTGEEKLLKSLYQFLKQKYLPDFLHTQLWEQLKFYFLVGGLPEAVDVYQENKSSPVKAFHLVREKQHEIIRAYYADIAKHSGKINAMHIDRVWRSVPAQLGRNQDGSTAKFSFKDIISGIDRYSRLANVIDWLISAGLLIKVPIVNSGHLPFSAHTKESQFKLYLFDVGILAAMNELSTQTILNYDYGSYKGYFAENYVAQELVNCSFQNLYGWQERQAEIEFLLDINGDVIPVEVKSGSNTHAKSLQSFVNRYHPKYRCILSAKNLFLDHRNQLKAIPLYLASLIASMPWD